MSNVHNSVDDSVCAGHCVCLCATVFIQFNVIPSIGFNESVCNKISYWNRLANLIKLKTKPPNEPQACINAHVKYEFKRSQHQCVRRTWNDVHVRWFYEWFFDLLFFLLNFVLFLISKSVQLFYNIHTYIYGKEDNNLTQTNDIVRMRFESEQVSTFHCYFGMVNNLMWTFHCTTFV